MLTFRRLFFVGTIFIACATLAPRLPRAVAEDELTLARIIPHDVFLFETRHKNPERQFLDDYWKGVMDSLTQSGIDQDLIEVIGMSLGHDEQHADEIERVKNKFSALIAQVDWCQLEGAESVFAERFTPIEQIYHGRPAIVAASLVWVARGTAETTRQNYTSLVAILEAVVEETNHVLGEPTLAVEHREWKGTQLASLNLLGALPRVPSLPLSVAMRDDLLMIAFREDLRDDVLALMEGSSATTSLADDARFRAAFAKLPPAEDCMTFFDMQALLKPLRTSIDIIFDAVVHPNDIVRNAGINAKASEINRQALEAYHGDHFAAALDLVKKAHEVEPKDAIIIYNLACFHALVGQKDKALDWLEKSVEAGFYSPHKIATDADLNSLRDEPRYKQALARARELAGDCSAEDVAIHFTNRGDVRRLRNQVQQAYEKQDYDQALEIIEQAYALAPHDSQVLYALGCLHTLNGHLEKGLEFLTQAVEAGFYCPKQIAKDPDWQAVRDNPQYRQAVSRAEELAAELAARNQMAKTTLIKQLIDRMTEAVGTLDYSATIESTDGHAVRTESITVLVPDAPSHAIYPVFSQRQPVTEFAQYLPQETAAFSISGGADPRALYQFIEDTLRGGGPLGEEMLTKWDEVQQEFGLNIKQDVFELLEGDSIDVTLGDGGGSVSMIKVSDEERAHQKIEQAMTALPQMLTKAISQQPALGALAALTLRCSPLTHESLEGFQNVYVAMSAKPVGVWGTADGFLIFGSSADAVALCLATSRNEHPNIRENPRVISEVLVPEGPFVSVSLADHRSSAKEIATAMGAGSMMGGMVAASMPKPELRPVVNKITSLIGKLVPVVQQADFFQSVASTTTFDGQMWRNRSVTHYKSPDEGAAGEPAR